MSRLFINVPFNRRSDGPGGRESATSRSVTTSARTGIPRYVRQKRGHIALRREAEARSGANSEAAQELLLKRMRKRSQQWPLSTTALLLRAVSRDAMLSCTPWLSDHGRPI